MRKVNILYLFIYAVGFSNAQTIVNGSLEKWGDDHLCEINMTPNDWTNYSTGCIALNEANFLICPTTIPPNASHGNIYARACAGPDWQGGEGLFQDVSSFVVGQSYTLHFDYAGSNLYGGSDSVKWRIYIDDTLVDQTPYFSSAKNTWSAHAFNFEATQTTHKIGIRAYFIFPSTTGDGSAAIDNISLSAGQAGLNEDLKANGIQIFPTLFQDQITVKNNEFEELEIIIFDVHGNLIAKERCSGSTSINLAHLSKGIYICHVIRNAQFVGKQSIVKL